MNKQSGFATEPMLRRRAVLAGLALAPLAVSGKVAAADLPAVRVGTLKFGTVNWELDVMSRHGLDRAHGFTLQPMDFAGKDGTAVALQGGAADLILTDWLWVAKRRSTGGDFTIMPHSHITGGLMVRKDAGILNLADLKGRKIGIGGGPADKSWIMLRAYAQKTVGLDLARDAEPVFAAPPLLNESLKRGDVPASLNFWQYNARLPSEGFIELVRVEDMLPALGLDKDMPLLGWVFSEHWASANPAVVKGFLAAAAEARNLLASSAEEWQAIKTSTQAENDQVLMRLRDAYKRGIIESEKTKPGDLDAQAQHMLDLLVQLGDKDEAPADGKLPPGTFFSGAHA